jgi:DNA-binding CsgD family transcriptional regulator/tetratricopeptide (TPR) repeat protein
MAGAARQGDLVGREEDLETLDGFLAALAAGAQALLVRGDPGIGKTSVWTAGCARAAAGGLLVLAVRGVEAEMPLGFAALGDLFEPVLDEIDALADPHRQSLAVAIGREAAAGSAPDRLAVSRGFLAALRALAHETPLLLAIDDVQWLDPASRRVLTFALRRLGNERVGVFATLRGGAETRDPLDLRTAFAEGRFREFVLGPLSRGAISHLVRSRVGGLTRALLVRLYDASAGNPMFALEFARRLPNSGAGQHPLPLPLPPSLVELVRDRVATIPAEVKPLIELIAALDRPTVSLLAKAFENEEQVERLLDLAADCGVLTVTAHGVARFTHPLLASAVYGGAPASRKRALHRQAATLVEDEEEHARHLALSTVTPQADVAALLEQAATHAATRGAPEAAADLAGEAVRLTPPAAALDSYQRTLARAGYLVEAGDVHGAQVLLEPLIDSRMPASVRSRALIARADCEFGDRTMLVDLLRRALQASGGEKEVSWHALIRYAQHGGWVSGDAETAVASAREALRLAKQLDAPLLLEQSALLLAYYEAAIGHMSAPSWARPVIGTAVVQLPAWQVAHASPGPPLMWAAELNAARNVFARQYDQLHQQGSVLKLPFLLLFMVELEWRAGNWALAQQYADEAIDILGSTGPAGVMVASYVRALLAASFGRVEEARLVASQAIAQAAAQRDNVAPIRNRWVLGFLELSHGDPARAWQSLEGVPEQLDQAGIRNPGMYPVLPDAVEALVGIGRLDQAESVLRTLEEQARSLEHRWAIPAAARASGLLLLARGATQAALAKLDAAMAGFAAIDHPVDLARSYLAAGSALRRLGERRRAAERIEAASEIFERLGATLWHERCANELRRARPRPRRDRELTATETRVAHLVARGRTNKEVAAELFTTVATVEAHLTRVYRKVGVRSRSELTRLIADGTLDVSID